MDLKLIETSGLGKKKIGLKNVMQDEDSTEQSALEYF